MRRFAVVSAITILLIDVLLASSVAAQAPRKTELKTITLGIASEIHQTEIEAYFRDFIHYVARRLSSPSQTEARIVVVPTQFRLASLLTERRVDFYMESPYPTYLINNVYGAGKFLLRRWKGGMAEYHALIFTQRNSETKRLDDLRGKIIAFEDPGSTSGYFLPRLLLSKRGFKLSQKPGIGAKVAPGEVGYIFAYAQDKLVDLVLTGQAAAGAFSNDDYAALDEKKKSNMIILAETDTLPRHLLSIRRDFPPSVANRLQKILLSMHEDPEGRLILEKMDGTTKFDTLPGGELAMRHKLRDTFSTPEKK